MKFIVVGCGHAGANLALRLFKSGHQVVVIDNNPEALKSLSPEFRGRTIEGDVLTEGLLERAGIKRSNGLATVTNNDSLNAVVGHIACHIYNLSMVVARNYEPSMRPVLEAFGLNVVSSTSWGAQRIEELMINPSLRSVYSAGNGEVEVYEFALSSQWNGKSLGDLLKGIPDLLPAALTRAGRAIIPDPDTSLETGDLLSVSATMAGIKTLSARLVNKEA
jgi:trk system potassium uptake protein TrkA